MKFQYIALSVASLFSCVKAEETANQKACVLNLLGVEVGCTLGIQNGVIVDYPTVERYANDHNVKLPFTQDQYNKCYSYILPVQTYDVYAVQNYYPNWYFVY